MCLYILLINCDLPGCDDEKNSGWTRLGWKVNSQTALRMTRLVASRVLKNVALSKQHILHLSEGDCWESRGMENQGGRENKMHFPGRRHAAY